YVLSIDSTWYYIFDTPPISGYTMSWFATTRRAQEEVVTRLNAIPELVILQRNGEEALDSVPLRERLPIIFRFVDEHFEEVFSHNAYRLLKRRGVQTIE
ncbi:MAG: hypothetical protein KDD70_17360, partial [Bdellovibrionales bacterium]|nr:hypothetical protein [Bdellovibrionales bacterium]